MRSSRAATLAKEKEDRERFAADLRLSGVSRVPAHLPIASGYDARGRRDYSERLVGARDNRSSGESQGVSSNLRRRHERPAKVLRPDTITTTNFSEVVRMVAEKVVEHARRFASNLRPEASEALASRDWVSYLAMEAGRQYEKNYTFRIALGRPGGGGAEYLEEEMGNWLVDKLGSAASGMRL